VNINRIGAARMQRIWTPVLLALLGLSAWECAARLGWISNLFFPAPSSIARTFVELVLDGTIVGHLASSGRRLFLGLLLGTLPGVTLGLLMGWSARARSFLDPFVAALHPIPKIAILPLIMAIFGIGEASRLVVIAVSAFFPMLINTMSGAIQISPSLFEAARNYGARGLQIFGRVLFPGSLPSVLSGFRLALNTSLLITVAVELVTARQGLGAMVWLAWETMRLEQLYAGLALMALLGIGFNILVRWLAYRLVPWQEDREG